MVSFCLFLGEGTTSERVKSGPGPERSTDKKKRKDLKSQRKVKIQLEKTKKNLLYKFHTIRCMIKKKVD